MNAATPLTDAAARVLAHITAHASHAQYIGTAKTIAQALSLTLTTTRAALRELRTRGTITKTSGQRCPKYYELNTPAPALNRTAATAHAGVSHPVTKSARPQGATRNTPGATRPRHTNNRPSAPTTRTTDSEANAPTPWPAWLLGPHAGR